MFNFLFKKNNFLKSINSLLKKVFIQLDEPNLQHQVDSGLIRNINSGFNNSYDFIFSDKVQFFENFETNDFVFSNIIIHDKNGNINSINIKIIANLIAGFSYSNNNFDYLNIVKIDTTNSKKITNEDFYIKSILKEFGIVGNFSSEQVYFVDFYKNRYLHLRGVLDGGFIGLLNNKLYLIKDKDSVLISTHICTILKDNIFKLSENELNKILIDN